MIPNVLSFDENLKKVDKIIMFYSTSQFHHTPFENLEVKKHITSLMLLWVFLHVS